MRFFMGMMPVVGALLLAGSAFGATWTIDGKHATASFRVRHLMISNVTGTIGGIEGSVEFDDKEPAKSKVTATLDATTIDTNEAKRDEHLRSPDFFDTAKYPKITFVSKSVKATGKGSYDVTGALTLHGVTKDIVLAVDGPSEAIKGMGGEMRRGLTATTTINRKDFGITWNKALDGGGAVVSDEVKITLDLELTAK